MVMQKLFLLTATLNPRYTEFSPECADLSSVCMQFGVSSIRTSSRYADMHLKCGLSIIKSGGLVHRAASMSHKP